MDFGSGLYRDLPRYQIETWDAKARESVGEALQGLDAETIACTFAAALMTRADDLQAIIDDRAMANARVGSWLSRLGGRERGAGGERSGHWHGI